MKTILLAIIITSSPLLAMDCPDLPKNFTISTRTINGEVTVRIYDENRELLFVIRRDSSIDGAWTLSSDRAHLYTTFFDMEAAKCGAARYASRQQEKK